MLPKKILFCTDFSENSKPAQHLACEYAKVFGASLMVVHVFTHGFTGESSIYDDFARQTLANEWALFDLALKAAEDKAHKYLNQIADDCRKLGVEVKVCLRKGNPLKEIMSCAGEESADLIVLGTHGWTGFNRLLLGSTAENVVRVATIPVLIVRSFLVQNESQQP